MTDERPVSSEIRNRARALYDSLGFSLFLWLFAVIVIAFAAYAFVSNRTIERQWNDTIEAWAGRYSTQIESSTRHAMLLNRKQDVHEIIRAIATESGIVGVRVFDKSGAVIFSGDPTEIGSRVDVEAESCVHCHIEPGPPEPMPGHHRLRFFENREGRVLGMTSPILNQPDCYNAACHAHPPEQTVLGVLDVRMSLAETDASLAIARRQAIVAAALTSLLAGLFSAIFIYRVVRRPVKELIQGTQRVAGGDLDMEIPADGKNELSRLARSFNAMTGDLRQARQENIEWSDRLETRLLEKTAELNRTQRQVVHMEKMASLGKLAATVAHELNNPLAGILNYAKLVDRTIRESDEVPVAVEQELMRYLGVIQKEAGRCGEIVKNLLLFARRSGVEFALHSLNTIIEQATMLVRHHLEMSDVTLEMRPIDGDDQIVCDADQLKQALLALFVNAVEAMPTGGTLSIEARLEGDRVRLIVADSGGGIPADVLPHVFEPFFSTKGDTEGAGSGLGLAVVYGIVQRHAGKIDVRSTVGDGTTFTIDLPRRPAAAGDAEA